MDRCCPLRSFEWQRRCGCPAPGAGQASAPPSRDFRPRGRRALARPVVGGRGQGAAVHRGRDGAARGCRLRHHCTAEGQVGTPDGDINPGQRLYGGFLSERAASSDYRGQLGLISTIRKDFQKLIELMDDWRKKPDDKARRPIDRIVLYIDDLDRSRMAFGYIPRHQDDQGGDRHPRLQGLTAHRPVTGRSDLPRRGQAWTLKPGLPTPSPGDKITFGLPKVGLHSAPATVRCKHHRTWGRQRWPRK
jgi:hypothetical protein